MMRLGHYRPVYVKSPAAQSIRTNLAVRMQLVALQLQCGDGSPLVPDNDLRGGPVTSLAFKAMIDEVERLSTFKALQAHLG